MKRDEQRVRDGKKQEELGRERTKRKMEEDIPKENIRENKILFKLKQNRDEFT